MNVWLSCQSQFIFMCLGLFLSLFILFRFYSVCVPLILVSSKYLLCIDQCMYWCSMCLWCLSLSLQLSSVNASVSKVPYRYDHSSTCFYTWFLVETATGGSHCRRFNWHTTSVVDEVNDGVSAYYKSRAFPLAANRCAENNFTSLPSCQLGAAHNARGADGEGEIRSVAVVQHFSMASGRDQLWSLFLSSSSCKT